MKDDSHKLVGAAFAVVSSAVPSWLLDTGTKVAVAVVTAFLTGIAYQAGRRMMEKKDDSDS